MNYFLNSILRFDKGKIDYYKGIRQGLLMVIPALIGYYLGYFSMGILVATGTLSHIYVFKGSSKSMIRTVIICSISFAICMMLGTLTVTQPLLFGLLLLIVTVIPFYIFNALKVAGPSSTFFIVTFSLSSNLPVEPEAFWIRGIAMLVGGALATLTVIIMIAISKERTEDKAIASDFKVVQNLMHHFNDPKAFKKEAQSAVAQFNNSDKLLITSTSSSHDKLNSRFQKLLLLHTSAQGIYSELLELHEKNIRPLPQDLINMMDLIIRNFNSQEQEQQVWSKAVDINEDFDNLEQHILKIDELMNAKDTQIEHEAQIREPLYSQRIIQNLTLDSYIFKNTLIYTVVMAIAILVSLGFNFQKSYWIPLSAHTVMLGVTTVRMLDRSLARGLGTIVGTLVLSGILFFNPDPVIAVLLMGLAAMLTESFVGSNYTFAVIFITIQVILLNGLASKNISISIAYTRILDVLIGISIAVVLVLILNRKTASSMLPSAIAEVVREEAIIFQYLFSQNHQDDKSYNKSQSLNLSVKINNMTQVYQSANGELFSNKEVIQYYYPSIYALEEMSFMLTRAMNYKNRDTISDEQIGEYLTTFENVAKHFELQSRLEVRELTDLPQYNYIKSALMNLQNNCVAQRKDIDEEENGSAIQQS